MATHVFDVAAFRAMFPVYADPTKYPDPQLSGYFVMATMYINPDDRPIICGPQLQLALDLMTAHLLYSFDLLAAGKAQVSVTTGASIDKVSVSLQPPPIANAWQQWLSTSPYGLQLWALLEIAGIGGITVGGSDEREGFRKAGGVFL